MMVAMLSSWASIASFVTRKRFKHVVVPVVAPLVVAEMGHRPILVEVVGVLEERKTIGNRTITWLARVIVVVLVEWPSPE